MFKLTLKTAVEVAHFLGADKFAVSNLFTVEPCSTLTTHEKGLLETSDVLEVLVSTAGRLIN